MKKFLPNTNLWDKLRKTIVKYRSDSEKTFDLIKNFIPQLPNYCNSEMDKRLVENKLPSEPTTEMFLDSERKELQYRFRALTSYTIREHYLLKTHVLKFLQVLDPTKSGIDIVSCNRYSNDKKYDCGAKVLSLRKFQKGEVLQYLNGVVASEKKSRRRRTSGRFNNDKNEKGKPGEPEPQPHIYASSNAIIPGVNDFSVTFSCRTKDHQLWLGPAAYMNHDCTPNCKFRATGTTKSSTAVYEVIKDIDPGEEICIHYGNNFFGPDNCQCECRTCELRNRGAFMSEVTKLKLERHEERMQGIMNGHRSNKKNKNNHKNTSSSKKSGKSSRSSSVCGSVNSEINIFHAGPNFSVRIGKYSLRHQSRADRKN